MRDDGKIKMFNKFCTIFFFFSLDGNDLCSIWLHRHTPTPLLQNTSSGWEDPAFATGDWWKQMWRGVWCHQCLSVHRAQLQLGLQVAYSAKYKSCKLTPRGANGTHAVTSLMTSHLRHSAVQSDTRPDYDSHAIRMCFCLLFFGFFCFVFLLYSHFVYIKIACCWVVRWREGGATNL